nr:hypothetical protein GCM10017611_07150 [Rhodococcus wratislaviensis]
MSQRVIAAMQLAETADELRHENAGRVAVHNMGGLAIANYVRVRGRRGRCHVGCAVIPQKTDGDRNVCGSHIRRCRPDQPIDT